jgi:hypothetical protein
VNRAGSTRRAVAGAAFVIAAVAIGPAVAGAQAPMPPPAPGPGPVAPAGAPERGRQMAADARYKVRVMEGVLEKSVQQAALRLNEQLRRVSPDLIQLTGAAHARGYRLEGYGLFFDVEVPAAMRQTMGWTARVMRQQQQGVSEALGSLKRIAGELDPKTRAEAERAMHQIELVVRPMPRVRVERSMPGGPAAVEAATSSAGPPAPAAPADAPVAMPGPLEADALTWTSPDLA